MKKTFLFFIALVLYLNANGQYQTRESSLQSLRKGNLDKAQREIDEACNHDETKNEAKTWYYASLIYSHLCSSHPSPFYLKLTLEKAIKCKELDQNNSYDMNPVYSYIGSAAYEEGIKMYNNKDFDGAASMMETAVTYLISSNRSSDAAVAYSVLGVCYLLKSFPENNIEVKCQLLKDAFNAAEVSTSLDENGNSNNIYIVYNGCGRTLYNIGVDYYKDNKYKECLELAQYAASCFENTKENDFKYLSDKLIDSCRDKMHESSQISISENTITQTHAYENPFNDQKADVDKNIPIINKKSENTYVFIIANENYPNRKVPYALNDGNVFKEYCNRTLGVSVKQIRLYENATTGQIIACVAAIRRASEANDGDLNVIFYYAGHAFPDEKTKDAYLLPIDGDNQLVETCYSLKRLYQELGSIKTKSCVCFLDACFSGATREDNMLLTGRGVAIKPKEETPQGNLIVFTSASGNETAHQYEEKQHGLFTYFLLKKMQDSKGTFTLGEMYDYVSKNVKKTSFDVNNKIQTPSVIPSETMTQKWRNIKL